MNISNRLKTVASFVLDNSYVIDVGCDHALLSIYLVKNKKNIKVIASDINEKPLMGAKENIKKYNVEDKILVKQMNGISDIDNRIDTIIISGMGTSTILDILFSDIKKLDNIKRIIISSNNDYYKLRSNICKNGFIIVDEEIVYEKGKYYPIIVFEKGRRKYSYLDLSYGPILIKNKSLIFTNYIKDILNKKINIFNRLSNKYILKKYKLKKEIRMISKII